jgi:hypothetical protein
MTLLLPIIEGLAEAVTNQERAQWLLAVPQSVLWRDQTTIRAVLRAANFREGVEALDAEMAALSAVRDPRTGMIPDLVQFAQFYARIGLTIIARGDAQEGLSHVSL